MALYRSPVDGARQEPAAPTRRAARPAPAGRQLAGRRRRHLAHHRRRRNGAQASRRRPTSPTPTAPSSGTPTATTTRRQRRIHGMILHCVRPARDGGENALMDHEMAYIALRDADPRWVRALMADDAMTIPARTGRGRRGARGADRARCSRSTPTAARCTCATPRARAASSGRTTPARARPWPSCVSCWRRDAPQRLRAAPAARHGHRRPQRAARRAAPSSTTPHAPRLLYRARYLDRVHGSGLNRRHVALADDLARRPTGGRGARRAAAAGARRRAELSEGLVSTDSLLQLYPQAQFEEHGLLERVAHIRDEAFGRRVRERLLPSQEVLAQRLFHQSQDLADAQRHLQRYHALVVSLQQRVRELGAQRRGDAALRRTGAPGHAGAGARAGHRIGRHAGGDGRYAQGHVGTGHRAPQRPRVHGRGPRHAAAGRPARRADAQLRLRQRHLRHVQGARHLRRGGQDPALRLPAVRGREAPGLHAGLRAHGGQQRADAGDCWRPPARATSRSSRSSATVRADAASWRPTRGCCTCRRRAATGCASWPGSR